MRYSLILLLLVGCATVQERNAAAICSKQPPACDFRWILGLPLDKAEAEAARRGFTVRAMKVDGEGRMGIENWRSNRINVATEKGVVTEVFDVG